MKKNLLLLAVMLLSFHMSLLFAQQKKRCATTEYMNRLKAEDAALNARLQQAELQIQQANQQNQNLRTGSTNTIITVPVVFHVLYNTPGQNISQNRILDQLAVLNKDFARLNADSNNTPLAFRPVSANTELQFCLAAQDPAGNPTNGIDRVSVTASGFDPISNDNINYTSMGGVDAWPRAQYLNIWVCNFSGNSNGILGIAQAPGGTAGTDGVCVLYTTVGGNTFPGTEPSYNLGRTLTHEVGHWFGLRHTWGDDSNGNGSCNAPAECNGTDFVSDTPNQGEENYGCPSFPKIDCCASATGGDPVNGVMFMNYMDYVDDNCMNMFTEGQSTRMHSAITALRPTIPTSIGCNAPVGITKVNALLPDVYVYPNPASANFTISGQLTRTSDLIVTVQNAIGETVYTRELKNVLDLNLPIDLSGKAPGIYNVLLRSNDSVINKKIVLAR